jgi:hypothetical protein
VLIGETSTIVVNFETENNQVTNDVATTDMFYFTQELLEYDCVTSLTGKPYALAATDSLLVDEGAKTTTTTIDNSPTENWNGETNSFCLQMKLWLKMSGTDMEWHKKDFQFTVDVTNPTGSQAFTVDTSGNVGLVANAAEVDAAAAVNAAGADPTISDPTIGAGAPFAYGDTITVTLSFDHPTDAYAYDILTTSILPLDPANADARFNNGADLDFETKSYISTGTFPTLGGQIDVTVPLAIYQMEPASIKISYTVDWSLKARRELRETRELAESGSTDYSVEVLLFPLKADNSGCYVIAARIATPAVGTAIMMLM